MKSTDVRRRNLLKMGSVALAAGVISGRFGSAYAAQHVDEKDAQAQSLGYKNNAAQVDRKKFANYQPGQACSSCNFFQGKASDAWAPCTIFTGKEVNAKGWCSSYVKRT